MSRAFIRRSRKMELSTKVAAETVKIMGRTICRDGILFLGQAGSFIEFEMEGTRTELVLDVCAASVEPSRRSWIAVYRDYPRTLLCRFAPQPGCRRYAVFAASSRQKAVLRVVKLSESGYGSIGIHAIVTDTGIVRPTAYRRRRIEFIGDSITCGYGVGQKNGEPFCTGGEDCLAAYAALAAERLGADYQIVAQSGIGVYSSYTEAGAAEPNRAELMPVLYEHTDLSTEKLRGFSPIKWDFRRFRPQLIVVNLGTNDASYVGGLAVRRQAFAAAYSAFLERVLRASPDAFVLCTLGLMDGSLCETEENVVRSLRKKGGRIAFYAQEAMRGDEGKGADGHPGRAAQNRAAGELVRQVDKWNPWEPDRYAGPESPAAPHNGCSV